MKLALDTADAIVSELNNQPFSESFTAIRRVLPEYKLAELKNLTVTVAPKSVAIVNVTRQSNGYEVAIDIGIQQKIGNDMDAEVEQLSELVTEIVTFLSRKKLSTLPAARFKSIVNEPVYVPEHLSEERLFTSILTVTYKVIQ